jgi:4-carboxymuconolactone decarboxylase
MISKEDKGRTVLAGLGPTIGAAIERAGQESPALERMLLEFGFGDAYLTGDLDLSTRELVTVAALAAMGGCEAPLRNHLSAAHAVGVKPAELLDVLVHLVPIIGFARVLVAVGTFAQWRDTLDATPEGS